MPPAQPRAMLRPGLLDGVRIVLAGAPGEAGFASSVEQLCTGLGALTGRWSALAEGSVEEREAAGDGALGDTIAELQGADMLVVDCAGMFERCDGERPLIEVMQAAWDATRAVANRAFIPGSAGGRVVLLAPPSGPRGGHAVGAAAGLENLARTLSVEWARYGVRIVALAPGGETGADEVAALCAYLGSPAGDYFSGCLLDLRGPA